MTLGRTRINEVVERFYRGASVADTATYFAMTRQHVEAILRQQIIELAVAYQAVAPPTP